MTDETKKEEIREFFTAPRPYLHLRTVAIGGCVAVVGLLATISGDLGAGLTVVLLGAAFGVLLPIRPLAPQGASANEARYVSVLAFREAKNRYLARADLEQVKAWLDEEVSRLVARSEERLGLWETNHEPIRVLGPLYSERVEGIAPELVLRRSMPEGYLYSTYRVSVFQLTDTLLGAYQCNFNLIDGTIAAEQTAEFFYRNVVAVRSLTESRTEVLKNGERLSESKVFALTVSGGSQIRIVLDDPAIRAGVEIRSLGDSAAANIRAMVRQYNPPLEDAS